MTELPGHQDLWGDLFEVAVKRGCINYLLHCKLLPSTDPAAQEWLTTTVRNLRNHLMEQLAATDEHYLQFAHSWLDHLLVNGYALGWTCLRQALRRFDPAPGKPWEKSTRQPHFKGLWCPLTLRDRRPGKADEEVDRSKTLAEFWQALHLDGPPDLDWLKQGGPARADFFLLLQMQGKGYLLCLEFSLNAPSHPQDFRTSEAHLRELQSYVRRIENRGVFTRLNAEVTNDHDLAIAPALASFMSTFSSPDKPLFKLCQASAYLTKLAQRLRRDEPQQQPLEVQALAITQSGIEGLAAQFDAAGTDPRVQLLTALGDTYRNRYKIDFDNPSALDSERRGAFNAIHNALPAAFRHHLKHLLNHPPNGEPLQRTITETVTTFQNPDTPMTLHEALQWVNEDAAITEWLGATPRSAVEKALHTMGKTTAPCLRDLHAAAVQASLDAAKFGQINVLALEGHPGIGKTTAVQNWLQQQTNGFLFVYISPRVVINSSVMTELAQRRSISNTTLQLSNILTLTSNRDFSTSAWSKHQTHSTAKNRHISGAVKFAGVNEATFAQPSKEILFLNTTKAQEVEQHIKAGLQKNEARYNLDIMRNNRLPGIWRTLGSAARQVLEANPTLHQLAITTAMQGYREREGDKDTVQGFSKLFERPHHHPSARQERRSIASRLPTIIVMLDEIAGDSAGVPATRAFAQWLEQEFIAPFTNVGETSPFRVILVVADASLGNAEVLQRHLESAAETPDKILISHSSGPRPFRLAATKLRIGCRRLPTLHIMADGFPAASPLTLHYELRLIPLVRPLPQPDKLALTPRQIIRKATDAILQDDAQQLIIQALTETQGQVIFFAQNKEFLETLKSNLRKWAENSAQLIVAEHIVTLHSNTPSRHRETFMQPAHRDQLRVILMTSSGSRGVSFPRATRIIATVPRFAVETGLMELAQLIYRGRGYYADPHQPGQHISGDHEQRSLTFLVHDFIITDPVTTADELQHQWTRQLLDVVTFLVLLRATVYTRLSGDAGMPRQHLAVAPVGRIGSDESETLLAEHISGLNSELSVLLADSTVTDRGQFKTALELIQEVFANSIYRQRQLSIAITMAKDFSDGLTSNAESLATTPVQWIIPDNLYGVGPLWMQRIEQTAADELYYFEMIDPTQRHKVQQLLSLLRTLKNNKTLSTNLHRCADALYNILCRKAHTSQEADVNTSNVSYTTSKAVNALRQWICLPVDYPRFMHSEVEPVLHDADDKDWWSALHRAVTAVRPPTSVFPALPSYRDKPFLVIITAGDPTDLERAMGDQYFMASSEVNLLNTLLFAK